MNMENRPSYDLGRIFAPIGYLIVLAGIALLGFIGYTVFQIVNDPESVSFVKFLLGALGNGDTFLYGYVGEEPFELNLTDPARTVVLLFFGVILFWILVGIAKSIIAAGLAIARVQIPPRNNQ